MPFARLFRSVLPIALAMAFCAPAASSGAALASHNGALEAGIERLRGATWWEANRKIRPELAQVGDLMFLLPLADSKLQPSSDAIGRVQRLRDALRSHLTKQPAGWNRLVEQVRAQRAKAGDMAAVLLADALVNEVRYRDGTDGTYYPPSRFFAESGVCKDFATAKYLLLRDAGFDIARLRLVSLAPRYNNTPDDWHVILVVQMDAPAEPLALDSPGAPGAPPARRPGDGVSDASNPAGPSALLDAILAGRKPADAVLRAPSGPLAASLAHSGQAQRPLATVFNETGSRSFERDAPGQFRRAAAGRVARPMYVDELGQPWQVDGSGTFPKWRVAAEVTAAPALLRVASR
jgi:predicted transglutaminase-like cysteine proteinase